MANVTDPLACAVHGTNPQNLIEYITRQRIYDSHFWKEECFGLNAVDVAEKAATRIFAVGGCYGGNRQPTRFLSLLLKLLQIQPEEEIVDELLQNEDFGYVRLLGATYLRLTGRPADIYEKLEPLYLDYRRVRYRTVTGWKTVCVDEYIQQLLQTDRICDIMLPRIPKRTVLEENGYLEGPRISPMHVHMEDDTDKIKAIQNLLTQMANDGCESAKTAIQTLHWDHHSQPPNDDDNHHETTETNTMVQEDTPPKSITNDNHSYDSRDRRQRHGRSRSRSWGRRDDDSDDYQNERHPSSRREDERGYRGSSRNDHGRIDDLYDDDGNHSRKLNKNEDEYNDQRKSRSSRSKPDADNKDHYDKNQQKKSKKEKSRKRERKKKKSKENPYGSLFKKSSLSTKSDEKPSRKVEQIEGEGKENNSEEYWNAERAKLGLKPLRK